MNWKTKLGLILIIASAILYAFAYVGFHEPDRVLFYIVIDLAFIPLDILIVVLVIESIIDKKEKEVIFEKFYSELGNDLLESFSRINEHNTKITDALANIDSWENKDFEKAYKYIESNGITFKPKIPENEKKDFIINLKTLLHSNRNFLINLIENPNLLEKDSFSGLILAIFHLQDELEHRTDLNQVSKNDFEHLLGDINRVYCKLTYQWIMYLQYLNKHYPYMSSIVLRTNPFNPKAKIYIDD